MKLGAAIAAATMLGSGAAETQRPDRFCADLRRVVEAAGQDPSLESLERRRAAPRLLGFGRCWFAPAARGRAWYCHQTMAPDELALASLAAKIAACLPEAEHKATSHPMETVFTLPRVRIRIRESGGPRAHVGRIVSLRVEAIPSN